MKIYIVGGVAGGATAATRLRRLNEAAEIIVLEKGYYVSFANCGLPYYVGGVVQDKSSLLVQDVDVIREKYNLDIRTRQEVLSINPESKELTIKDLETDKIYTEKYDKLLLSPGAKPFIPAIPGVDAASNTFSIRTIKDVTRIVEFIGDGKNIKSAAIIGGGFIGMEMAENLHIKGLKVSIIENSDQVIAPQDPEMAAIIHRQLRMNGIDLYLSSGVSSIQDQGKLLTLNGGQTLSTDMIILAAGLHPDTAFLKDSGIELSERGAIKVNDQLLTSKPDIYAIGDAILVKDFVNQSETSIMLAGPANRQARIAADNMLGGEQTYAGTIGTSIFKLFDLAVASTGNNEKTLRKLNLPFEAIHIHPNAHAGYYPDAGVLSMKLLFNPETKLIWGAQIIGTEGVDKRIDVISTAIKTGFTADRLWELELAYAPPYSSAKDPINMLGYIVNDIIQGLVKTIQWDEVQNAISSGEYFVLDVRDEYEIELGTLANYVNIPLGKLRSRISEIPRDKKILVYCQVGLRGYIAARILSQSGYTVENLDGGYKTYANVFEPGQSDVKTAETGQGVVEKSVSSTTPRVIIDAVGLQCPGPIQRLFAALSVAKQGDEVEITASDPGFANDIKHWCDNTKNTLVSQETIQGERTLYKAIIAKGGQQEGANFQTLELDKKMTLIVFDGDLDKAIAAFILANGARSFGKEVTMFFTFWGLNILRASKSPAVKKGLLEKAFGWMMPQGTSKLGLSKMNMLGMGAQMIRYIMQRKNVDSIETMLEQAKRNGVRLIACTMSMDLLGIKQEELISGVELGGVATYLSKASEGNINLFV